MSNPDRERVRGVGTVLLRGIQGLLLPLFRVRAAAVVQLDGSVAADYHCSTNLHQQTANGSQAQSSQRLRTGQVQVLLHLRSCKSAHWHMKWQRMTLLSSP